MRIFDHSIQEQIDACRPASRDHECHDMAELSQQLGSDADTTRCYRMTQRLDAHLMTTFQDVPVPEGLAARILERLAPEHSPRGRKQTSMIGRRIWLRGSLLVAASLLAAALVALLATRPNGLDHEIATDALGWYQGLPHQWQDLVEVPQGFAIPESIVARPHGWQAVSRTISKRGIVYDLSGLHTRAVLFILAINRPGLPLEPPLVPQSTTGGCTIAAWQTHGLVYVLVVEGDPKSYQRIINPAQPPLA